LKIVVEIAVTMMTFAVITVAAIVVNRCRDYCPFVPLCCGLWGVTLSRPCCLDHRCEIVMWQLWWPLSPLQPLSCLDIAVAIVVTVAGAIVVIIMVTSVVEIIVVTIALTIVMTAVLWSLWWPL